LACLNYDVRPFNVDFIIECVATLEARQSGRRCSVDYYCWFYLFEDREDGGEGGDIAIEIGD
jgi:hypothetical protein